MLVYTLVASLLIAMFVVPALGSIFGRAGHLTPENRRQLMLAEEGDLNEIGGWTGVYMRVVTRAINHPGRTVGLLTTMLILVFIAYGTFGRGVTLFPQWTRHRAASTSAHAVTCPPRRRTAWYASSNSASSVSTASRPRMQPPARAMRARQPTRSVRSA